MCPLLSGLRNESGQVIVLAAVGMSAIMGFMALAVDVGQVRYAKRQMQMQVDAAALAGALEVSACAGVQNCSALRAAAQNALTENGATITTVLTNCAPGTGTTIGLTMTINNGPCAQGAADPNKGKSSFVEVLLAKSQPTYFARVLGFNSVPLAVRAEAARTNGTNCMYALDPTSSNALSVDLLASVNSSCGIMVESSSSSALGCSLLA